jgi:glycosyltransferase involved in cell wall biosynthesis
VGAHRAPRVTLGVTTYNVERYLPGALDSLLAQDYTDFEIVACDNVSTDSTWDILSAYADKDSRLRIYRNPENLGEAGNFHRVVSLARGEFFRASAHDDIAAPGLLSACVAALDANPKAVLAFPSTILIDGDGNEIGPWEDHLDLRQGGTAARIAKYAQKWNICNEVFGLIRTDVLRRTRMLGPFLSSDVRMLHELALRGEFVQLPERLFYRRMHATVTFGADRDTDEVLEWLEPGAAAAAKKKKKRRPASSQHHHTRMTWETTKALLNADEVPLGRRVEGTAAFLTAWGARRGRARLGRLKQAVTGSTSTPPPWEKPLAESSGEQSPVGPEGASEQ